MRKKVSCVKGFVRDNFRGCPRQTSSGSAWEGEHGPDDIQKVERFNGISFVRKRFRA